MTTVMSPTAAPVPARPASRPLVLRIVDVRRWPIHGVTNWFGVGCVVAFLLIATVGQLIGDPTLLDAPGAEPPSAEYWFGTDTLGRDVFARTAEGAWNSLTISLGTVLLSLSVAMPLGMLAGYHYNGRLDNAIMRGLETVQALPMFVFVMFVLTLTGTGTIEIGPVTFGMRTRLIVCLALGFVPFFARIVRAATLVEMQDDYVAMLQVLGVGRTRILLSEISVNVLPPMVVQACLAMAIAIFAEGGLSFLGFGLAPPEPTLGNLIADAGSQILEGAWWYATLPGAVMVLGILGFNLLGDALSDALLGGSEGGAE
ncbi:ABC transporter permease subunit [Nocardioides soli]|uniref:Peptide/nickel transport system permease protein n=1 Tax=Nocardioides soli TaxID=1036020 RepID=A0A7W4VTK1_9ACTN|nr:peptide/nickel transport system permease protein [Nocardioides soli]